MARKKTTNGGKPLPNAGGGGNLKDAKGNAITGEQIDAVQALMRQIRSGMRGASDDKRTPGIAVKAAEAIGQHAVEVLLLSGARRALEAAVSCQDCATGMSETVEDLDMYMGLTKEELDNREKTDESLR